MSIKKALFLADAHYPHFDKKVFNIQKQIAKDTKPDILCYVGDMFDAQHISKFTLGDYEDGIYQTEKEILGFKEDYHKEIVKACNNPKLEILWTLGNHDGQRIDKVLEKVKAKAIPEKYEDYRKKLDVRSAFPEVKFKQYNDTHKIGKLYITHGEYYNKAHAEKHALEYGVNVLYGHLHTWDVKTIKTKAKNKVRSGYSMPCSCQLDYGYHKNRSSSWVNGLSIGEFMEDGFFNLYTIVIINNKCSWHGKLYKG